MPLKSAGTRSFGATDSLFVLNGECHFRIKHAAGTNKMLLYVWAVGRAIAPSEIIGTYFITDVFGLLKYWSAAQIVIPTATAVAKEDLPRTPQFAVTVLHVVPVVNPQLTRRINPPILIT